MSDFLVVRLEAGDEPRWVCVDGDGVQSGPAGRGRLADAAEAAAGRRVIALAPALDVLRTRADVPVRGTAKLLQALPFAMEEQLAEDVDSLHFAAGPRDPEGQVPVAVVRRERLAGWLEALADAGLDVAALYSEADGIDDLPGTAVLVADRERLMLRDADGALAALDGDEPEAVLELWLGQAEVGDDDRPAPRHLYAYLSPDREAELGASLEALRPRLASVEMRVLPDGALPRLAARIAANPGVNLLQGGFARRSNLARHWPAWRAAAVLVGALGVLALGARAAEVWQNQRRAAALDTAIAQAYQYTFPGSGPLGPDPRAQFESRLKTLGGPREGGQDARFLDTLSVVAGAITRGGGARLEGLDYRAGILELELRAPSVEVLDRIRKEIGGGGELDAEIQSANADDGAVLGRLRVRPRGA